MKAKNSPVMTQFLYEAKLTSKLHLASRNKSTQQMIELFLEEKWETTLDSALERAMPQCEAFRAAASFPPSPHIAVMAHSMWSLTQLTLS
jgi:hypothetical protein